MTTERYSLSAQSISALFGYLKEQPYASVRGLFDLFDNDLAILPNENLEVKEDTQSKKKRTRKAK